MTLTWGAVLPHGAAGEFDGSDGVAGWARLLEAARAWDGLGYDHLWMSDHFMPATGDRSGPCFEAYTSLAAASQVTSRAHLGVLVTSAFYRSTAMLAKQAAMVDLMSGGRLILGIGGGWDKDECESFGVPFPSAGDRVGLFTESLEALKLLWTQPAVTYPGRHVQLTDAHCNPRPARPIPVWTGTHGPRGLRAAARLADVCNWNVGLEQFRELSAVLDRACAAEGRTVQRSVFRLVDLSEGSQMSRALVAASGAPPEAFDAMKADHFIGNTDEVTAKVQAFVDEGATHVLALFLDGATSDTSAQLFRRDIVPGITTR